MSFVFADNVKETSTTTGTGTITVGGAVTGSVTFAAVGDGNSCIICIRAVNANGNPSGAWEVCESVYTVSGTTLTRGKFRSSSSGSRVSFASGTKHVSIVYDARSVPTNVVHLSTRGIDSDAAGAIGYGETAPSSTDQTAAIQAVIDSLPSGAMLIWDVAVGLSATIQIPSNITIQSPSRAFGAILRAAANCPMFANAGIATDASSSLQNTFGLLDAGHSGNAAYRLLDPDYFNNENITIIGGTWNGNVAEQTGHPFTASDGFLSVFKFWGVRNLTLKDLYLLKSFSPLPISIANWYDVTLENIEIDNSPLTRSSTEVTTGGIQLQGPGQLLNADLLIIHANDDAVALNADESDSSAINTNYGGGSSVCTPGTNWVQCGDITDVRVSRLILSKGIEDTVPVGSIRVLSNAHLADNIIFDDISGLTSGFANHFGVFAGCQISGSGNIGSLEFHNCSLDLQDPDGSGEGDGVFDCKGDANSISIINRKRSSTPDTVPDVNLSSATIGKFLLTGEYYENAVPQILCGATVNQMLVKTNSYIASPTAAPVLKTKSGAVVTLFDYSGDTRGSTNIVDHAVGSLETVTARGSHRKAGGGSPLAIATALTVTNTWYKDLAFVAANVFNSGAGSVTNNNAYLEAAVTIVEDAFTGTNGDALNGRTPSPTTAGHNWATIAGTSANQTIQSNKASFAVNAALEALAVDSGISDCTITGTGTIDSATTALIVIFFRVVDSNNNWQFWFANGTTALYKVVSGVSTLVDSQSIGHTPGTPYAMSVTLSGNAIACQVAAENVLSATDSFNATETKHGIGAFASTAGTQALDNFEVVT